jgi:hypothetical protein
MMRKSQVRAIVVNSSQLIKQNGNSCKQHKIYMQQKICGI